MVETVSFNPNQQTEGKKDKTVLSIVILVVIIAIAGGIFMLRQPKKTEQPKVTITVTQGSSPTEKPKIDKNLLKIQVINGTGTPGQAGTVVEALKKAEYNADNITTSNLEEFNSTVTTIEAKDGFDNVVNDIKNILKTSFDKITIDSTPLAKDNEFDIVVTTGGKKFEEPTSTVSPTQSPTETITLTPSSTSSPTPTSTP